MKLRVVHQEDDSPLVTWTVTAGFPVAADRVYTITGGQVLDVTFDCDTVTVEKDGVEQALTLTETTEWTLYLRGSVDAFPRVEYLDSGVFGIFAFFFAWLVVKLFSR
jgi:hypothetical protein